MPLYEYQCDACSHRFEVIRKFSDPPIAICPKCGSSVRKLIASPAFHLKGTGWYVTDYAKKDAGSKEKEQEKEKEKGAASGGSEKGAPDKPDTDKAAKPDKADTTTKPAATSSTPSASSSSSKE